MLLLPVEFKFTKNTCDTTSLAAVLGGIGEYGQNWWNTSGFFSMVSNVKAISSVTITSGPNSYNCNSVLGNLSNAGGCFKVEVMKLPPGDYTVNITIDAMACVVGSASFSKVEVIGPDGNDLLTGFANSNAVPFSQVLTLDVPVTADSSGTAFVAISKPSVTSRNGGSATQSMGIKINSVTNR